MSEGKCLFPPIMRLFTSPLAANRRCSIRTQRSNAFAAHLPLAKVIRCPECSVPSSVITPSTFWVTDTEEKRELLDEFKRKIATIPCKYFGTGECPFGETCHYVCAVQWWRVFLGAASLPLHAYDRPTWSDDCPHETVTSSYASLARKKTSKFCRQ